MSWILGPGFDLNQKKNEAYARKEKEYQANQARENGVERDSKKGGIDRLCFSNYNQYYVDTVILDPWHFMLFWRSVFSPHLFGFYFYFQVVGDNEYECVSIYSEHPLSLEREKLGEDNDWYNHLKKGFPALNQNFWRIANAANAANTMPPSQPNFDPSKGMRLKFYNKDCLVLFVHEITKQLIVYSVSYMSRNR